MVGWSWKDLEAYFEASLCLNCNVMKNPRSVVDHCIWIQVTANVVVMQVFKLSQLTAWFGHCHDWLGATFDELLHCLWDFKKLK